MPAYTPFYAMDIRADLGRPPGISAWRAADTEKSQTPPDLVVKSQPIDIIEVI
jgi:hypothetical protein